MVRVRARARARARARGRGRGRGRARANWITWKQLFRLSGLVRVRVTATV